MVAMSAIHRSVCAETLSPCATFESEVFPAGEVLVGLGEDVEGNSGIEALKGAVVSPRIEAMGSDTILNCGLVLDAEPKTTRNSFVSTSMQIGRAHV